MITISTETYFEVAILLMKTHYFNVTTQAIELYYTFQYLQENYISIISEETKLPPATVELFFNQTLPCMKNITLKADRDGKKNDNDYLLKSFWNKW